MTQEEKQLLIKDLCGRLPYGVYVDIYSWQKDSPKLLLECIPEYVGEEIVVKNIVGRHPIKEVKPYLRPLSSMTEEEKKEFNNLFNGFFQYFNQGVISASRAWDKNEAVFVGELDCSKLIDWLNAHHFDYRGLIEKWLALEAPEGMYK